MKWEADLYKRSGEKRKQFSSWAIPKHIRDSFAIVDGMSVPVRILPLDDVRDYKITSGGEIRLPKEVSDQISLIAEKGTKAIVFSIGDINEIDGSFDDQVQKSLKDDPTARQSRLARASKRPTERTTTVIVYDRNPDVVAEVLARADGNCEECRKAAPFLRKKDGSPYLEVHHRIRLADGGDDSVKNAYAMCPNCHRKAHYGQ